MTYKIQKMGIFATYKTREQLEAYIEKHIPKEKALLYLGMGLTWNYLAHKLEEHNKKVEAQKNGG